MAKTIKAGVKITGDDRSKGAFSSLAQSLARADNKISKFKNSMKPLASAFGMVAGGMAAAGAAIGAAVGAVAVGTWKMVDEIATAADEMSKFARQTGFDIEALQELEFVAGRNGIAIDKFRAGIVRFEKTLADLDTGATITQLEKVDKSLAAAVKSAPDAASAFDVLLDSIQSTENPTKKSAIAFAVFGKSGQQMLRLLDGGPEVFAALREEARRYGLVTAQGAKDAEAFKDAQENMRTALRGLKIAFAQDLMPVLTPAIQGIADFVAKNRAMVSGAFTGAIKSMGEMLANMIKMLNENPDALRNFFEGAGKEIKGFVDEIKNVKNLIADMKGFFGLGPDRRERALKAAGTTIVQGTAGQTKVGGVRGAAEQELARDKNWVEKYTPWGWTASAIKATYGALEAIKAPAVDGTIKVKVEVGEGAAGTVGVTAEGMTVSTKSNFATEWGLSL